MGGISNSSISVQSNSGALHIDISEAEVVYELEREAKRSRKTMSALVSKILLDHLEELEDYRMVKAAIKKDKGKPSIPWAEVKRRNGLAD